MVNFTFLSFATTKLTRGDNSLLFYLDLLERSDWEAVCEIYRVDKIHEFLFIYISIKFMILAVIQIILIFFCEAFFREKFFNTLGKQLNFSYRLFLIGQETLRGTYVMFITFCPNISWCFSIFRGIKLNYSRVFNWSFFIHLNN